MGWNSPNSRKWVADDMICKRCGMKIPEYSDAQQRYYLKNKKRLNAKRRDAYRKAKLRDESKPARPIKSVESSD